MYANRALCEIIWKNYNRKDTCNNIVRRMRFEFWATKGTYKQMCRFVF